MYQVGDGTEKGRSGTNLDRTGRRAPPLPKQVRYQAAPHPATLNAPGRKVYHPVRKRRAARTARPRGSTRAFSSGGSSAKVRSSGGEREGGSPPYALPAAVASVAEHRFVSTPGGHRR